MREAAWQGSGEGDGGWEDGGRGNGDGEEVVLRGGGGCLEDSF